MLTADKLSKWREQLAPIFERRAEFEWRLTVGFWLGQSLLGTSATAADNEMAADWWIDARAARRRPLAILHVGPRKMASSSLAAIANFAGERCRKTALTPLGSRLGRSDSLQQPRTCVAEVTIGTGR